MIFDFRFQISDFGFHISDFTFHISDLMSFAVVIIHVDFAIISVA